MNREFSQYYFFLGIEFCLKKANIASFDSCFQKIVLQVAKKCEEIVFIKPDFIEKIQEIIVEKGEDEFTDEDILKFEKMLK